MLDALTIQCPYCGELITLFIEPDSQGQDYIEDCTVCCRPIELHLNLTDEGVTQLTAKRDDD